MAQKQPGGRTYGCMELVPHPDVASRGRSLWDVGYIELGTYTTTVLNGAWVLDSGDRFSYPDGGHWLVGAHRDEVTEVTLDTTLPGLHRSLFVCSKPFGFVSASRIDQRTDPRGLPSGDMNLNCARQVWKGELGRTVPIVRPPYTRIRRGRREYSWVRLGDLADASGAYNLDQLIELVLGYWSFGGHEQYRQGLSVGQLIDFIEAHHPDLEDSSPNILSLNRENFVTRAMEDTSDMWIRRGFAFTILRLQALGFQPEVMQPA